MNAPTLEAETAAVPTHQVTRGGMLVPDVTAFLAGLCIMTIELLAGNVAATYVGMSLHTWTSTIGAILAGMAIGNYVGGRLADRYPAGRTLAILFFASSAACALIYPVNAAIGQALDGFDVGPSRIAVHITVVFFLPGMLLGTMSPVIARMALDQGRASGRTVGSVFACNALGSIAGTFVAGFFLMRYWHTSWIVWSVVAALALLGLAYAIGARRTSR